MEHLGVEWNMDLTNETMFTKTVDNLNKAIRHIHASTAESSIKLTVLRVSLLNQLIYETKFAPWHLSTFEKIDKILDNAYKKISHNMQSYPSKLLYVGKQQLGLGLPKYSSLVQLAKLHMFQRSLYCSSPRRKFILQSLLARVIKQMSSIPCRYGPYTLSHIHHKSNFLAPSYWFTSLATHLHSHGITLSRSPIVEENLPSSFSSDILQSNLYFYELTQSKNIMNPLEGIMSSDMEVQLSKIGLSNLHEPSPILPLPLRQGQIWSKYDSSNNTWSMIEITGFLSDRVILYFNWSVLTSRDGLPHKVCLLDGTSNMRGAGSNQMISITEFFTQQSTIYYLVSLDTEKYTSSGNQSICIASRRRTPLLPHTYSKLSQSSPTWFQDIHSELVVHTSIKDITSFRDRLTDNISNSAKTILIKTDLYQRQHVLIINHTQSNLTSPSSHAFSLHAASHATLINKNQTYFLTNKTAINTFRKATSKPVADPVSILLNTESGKRMFPIPPLSQPHQHCYNDIKMNPNKIYLLLPIIDLPLQSRVICKLIDRNKIDILAKLPITVSYESDMSYINQLSVNTLGALCYIESGLPLLSNYQSIIEKTQYYHYLNIRDKYRLNLPTCLMSMNDDPRYWRDSSTTIASAILKKKLRGCSTQDFINRIIFDKHRTGRNKVKETGCLEDGKCPMCGGFEDQKHILVDCTFAPMVTARLHHHKFIIDSRRDIKTKNKHRMEFQDNIISLLESPSCYALRLGRVHNNILNKIKKLTINQSMRIPGSNSKESKIQFQDMVQLVTPYLVLSIVLYRIRSLAIKHLSHDSLDSFPTIDQDLQHGSTEDILHGITHETIINMDGTKVSKVLDGYETIQQAYKRTKIHPGNSIASRTRLTKHNRVEEALIFSDNCKLYKQNIHAEAVEAWSEMFDPNYKPPLPPKPISVAPSINRKLTQIVPYKPDIMTNILKTRAMDPLTDWLLSAFDLPPSDSTVFLPTNVPHGPIWCNMSCASDCILFLLQMISHQLSPTLKLHMLQQIIPSARNLIETIDLLNPTSWFTNIELIRDVIYSGEESHLRGDKITLTLVLDKLLLSSTISLPTIFTCFNKKNLLCSNKHITHKNTYTTTTVSVISPTSSQSFENIINETIINVPKKASLCKNCSNPHNSYSIQVHPPRILFITFTDLVKNQHQHINIPHTMKLNTISYFILGVTYANTSHFVQRNLHNNDIILYDGMVNNGKTTFMPYSPNPFPFKYIEHGQTWNAILITYSAHTTSEYIIHGQYPITSSIPIILTSSNVIDLTDDTPDSSSDELSTVDIILTSSDESSSTVPSNTSSKLETNKRTSPNEENSQNITIRKK